MHLVRVVWYVWYVCKCFNGLLDIHFPVLNLNFPKRWLTLRRRVYAIRDQPQVQNIPKCKNLMCKIWPYLTSSPRHFRQHFTAANCSDGRWVSCSQPKIIQNHSESVASCGFKYKSTTENDVNIFFFSFWNHWDPRRQSSLGEAHTQLVLTIFHSTGCPPRWLNGARRSREFTGFFSQFQVGDPPNIDGPWGILTYLNHI